MAPERQRALIDYVSTFGSPIFDSIDRPGIDIEQQRDARDIQEASASPPMQAALLRTLYSADVSQVVERLGMPTLVLHGRGDRLVPFALGRDLAARLPQAKFVPFEGNSAAAWTQSHVIIPEIHGFLGIEVKPQKIASTTSQDLITILFTDVEASTALTQRLGDQGAREVLRTHERIVREALQAHGGSEVKTMGDGFMASFSSASRALECAIAMQRAFAQHNDSAEETLRVRIGLNAGEPIAEEEDLFGTAVNLAARIAAQAQGGEILASDVMRQLVAGKGFLFADRGESTLRGFEDPVRLYEVGWEA
jgi:class 3 adenylate cyclase